MTASQLQFVRNIDAYQRLIHRKIVFRILSGQVWNSVVLWRGSRQHWAGQGK